MRNKRIKIVLLLLMASIFISMNDNGWDWLGGLALIIGTFAVLKKEVINIE